MVELGHLLFQPGFLQPIGRATGSLGEQRPFRERAGRKPVAGTFSRRLEDGRQLREEAGHIRGRIRLHEEREFTVQGPRLRARKIAFGKYTIDLWPYVWIIEEQAETKFFPLLFGK